MDKPLAITCGDPAGVGPEIIQSWLKANPAKLKDVCLIGPASWLSQVSYEHAKPVGDAGFVATPGVPSEAGARIAADALDAAAYGCRSGDYSGVVTAPISKHWMQKVGWSFPGQTEYFADVWYGQPTMAFAGGQLNVVLLTWHIPFTEVPNHLSRESIERAVKSAAMLARALGSSEPRIAVCGLNPHAGEAGLLGYEEQNIINPILDVLRQRYPNLSDCQPGDTVFWRQMQGEFDVVVALYHDQGLAPLKTVDFDSAVNITLGLPFIRTSPDHGTAFGIAGQGKASFSSFANAVKLAEKLRYSCEK